MIEEIIFNNYGIQVELEEANVGFQASVQGIWCTVSFPLKIWSKRN